MIATARDIDGLPCFVPFERGRRPSPYVEETLRNIERRHCSSLRAVYAPAHVCNVRGPNNAPIVGAWVIVQRGPFRIPGGHQMRSPGGVVLTGTISAWQLLWVAENEQERKVYDLTGDDGPAAIARFYRFTSWSADERAQKAAEFDAMATAAMLDSLRRRREALRSKVDATTLRAVRDEVQTAVGACNDVAAAKEVERRSAEVAPRAMEAHARYAVTQDVRDAAMWSEAMAEMSAPVGG